MSPVRFGWLSANSCTQFHLVCWLFKSAFFLASDSTWPRSGKCAICRVVWDGVFRVNGIPTCSPFDFLESDGRGPVSINTGPSSRGVDGMGFRAEVTSVLWPFHTYYSITDSLSILMHSVLFRYILWSSILLPLCTYCLPSTTLRKAVNFERNFDTSERPLQAETANSFRAMRRRAISNVTRSTTPPRTDVGGAVETRRNPAWGPQIQDMWKDTGFQASALLPAIYPGPTPHT